MSAAEQIVEVLPELAPDDPLRLLVENGGGTNLAAQLERLRRGLEDQSLPLTLTRQVMGYWFAPYQEIPFAPPSYQATGAVLPRVNEQLTDSATTVVLDLVPIDFVWFPLSRAGVYTYAHSLGLMSGERWRFVPVGSWPIVYTAELCESIHPSEIEPFYAAEAASRARRDHDAIQLRLTLQK